MLLADERVRRNGKKIVPMRPWPVQTDFNHEWTLMNTNGLAVATAVSATLSSFFTLNFLLRCLALATLKRANLGLWFAALRVSTLFSRLAWNTFMAIPNFTRSRRSMSLTDVRRLDRLQCKIGR
jgi:hypothetical protein